MSKWAYGFGRIVPKPAIYLRPRRVGQNNSRTSGAGSACFPINDKIDTIKASSSIVMKKDNYVKFLLAFANRLTSSERLFNIKALISLPSRRYCRDGSFFVHIYE